MLDNSNIRLKTVNLKITGISKELLSIEVAVRYTDNNKLVSSTVFGSLPPLPQELLDAYADWKRSYLSWGKTHRYWKNQGKSIEKSIDPNQDRSIKIPTDPIETNISIQDCDTLEEKLIQKFNSWLDVHESPGLSKVAASLITSAQPDDYRDHPELLSFIVQTKTSDSQLNLNLQKLPWNEWEFIRNNYNNSGIALSTERAPIVERQQHQLKALVICGQYDESANQIDLKPDLAALREHLGYIDLEILKCNSTTSKPELLKKLDESTYNLLFFCGHSSSNNQIQLNDSEYIFSDDPKFRGILTKLKNKGLILAFFNSCDGLGIAHSIMSVGIPYVVVMKEPVHDGVAQNFIENFLKEATKPQRPIHLAVHEARLALQWLAGLPHGEFLPVLFQNPEQPPLYLNPQLITQPTKIPTPRPKWIKYLIVAAISALAILIWASAPELKKMFVTFTYPSICKFADENKDIGCGEEPLLVQAGGSESQAKKEGFDLIKKGLNNPLSYSHVIPLLEKDWKEKHDPETAIAIENASIALQSSQGAKFQVKNIAIVAPTKTNTPFSIADSLLKGIAYAQQQHNRANQDWKLRVIIANDENDPSSALKIALALANREDILGIIGHYSSYVTVPIVNKERIYENKVVLISPTATSHELTDSSNFFFRVVPSSVVSAKDMAKKWMTPDKKIVIFYRPDREFSNSLTKMFESAINAKSIIKKVDLGKANNISNEIKEAKRLGANAIVLFPDAYTGEKRINDRSAEILRQNNGEMPILGNTSIYDLYDDHSQTKLKKLYENVVMAIPWEYQDTLNSKAQYNKKLIVEDDDAKSKHNELPYIPSWWLTDQKSISTINERIVMSYDATLVLIKALNKDHNNSDFGKVVRSKAEERLAIQKLINDRDFRLEGITGNISFVGSDRKEEMNSLVTPTCDETQCNGLKPYRK